VGTLSLSDRDGRTLVTQTVMYDTPEAREAVLKSPMEKGVEAGYKRLEELLSTLG